MSRRAAVHRNASPNSHKKNSWQLSEKYFVHGLISSNKQEEQ
jgi:hypothetical protein